MSLLTEKNLQTEIVNFARSLVKDPDSGETTTSESFNGDDSTVNFTLTNHYASCINSVTVGTAKKWGIDYTYNFTTRTITFTTAPGTGTGNVVINYDYVGAGTTLATINSAWGVWGYPSLGLQPSDYPKFGMIWNGVSRGASGLGYDGLLGERFLRVWVYSEDSDQVKLKLAEFANDFAAKTDWYLEGKAIGKRMVPVLGPNEPALDARRKGRYFGGFVDFMIPLIYESI